MSRKIETTYTADPAKGSDPSANYKFAANKDTTDPCAMDIDQLAAAIAVRLEGYVPPIPPTEDEFTPFVVTIQNNTLQANINPVSGADYTHYVILTDDATTPTYPDDFTAGAFPSLKAVAAFDVDYLWYPWAYDTATSTMTELTNPDLTSGIAVTASDTLGPVWLSGTNGFTVDNSGNYTIVAPTDAGIGLASTEIYDIYVNDALHLAKFTSLTGTLSLAGGTYSTYAVARDLSGNEGQSDIDTFTIATTGAGTVSLPSVTQEVAEDGTSTTVTLTRTGGTADFDIDVSTRDITALAGVGAGYNYTAIDAETVEFRSASNSETITFEVRDDNEVTNRVCNIEIDYDNNYVNGANAGTVEVGTESVLMKIIGTGVTAFAGYQMTTADPFYVSIQAENYANGGTARNSIKSGQETDQWVINYNAVRYADGNRIHCNDSISDYGSATVLSSEAPYTEYQIHFTAEAVSANGATDQFDIWTRAATPDVPPTGDQHFHYTLVNPITSIVWSAPAGGTATITMDYNAGPSMAGNTVWLEGVTGDGAATYNAVAGLTVATHTLNTNIFTVTGVGADLTPDAGTGNVLGCDETALNVTPPALGDWYWVWCGEDEASNQISVYVDEAATRYLRIYQYHLGADIDVITVSARQNNSGAGWAKVDVNVIENGTGSDPSDEDMGHVESNYSSVSTGDPGDNSLNPAFPYLPLPDTTVASLGCA